MFAKLCIKRPMELAQVRATWGGASGKAKISHRLLQPLRFSWNFWPIFLSSSDEYQQPTWGSVHPKSR